ncbi:DNA-binding PadR family transcriptional regulator [Actinocorallia herbida]|uniref:DNA-binding PadR family transcriptional regulator n=1 Tax=Actinocorallia herbida TaxID=58109 RepID=A0A3N1D737_9ACTN|nr:PadR family transcriptional regulator [Actinocorallia herbida]ROO89342.1 DNA-binding PadR family transcriptional regulator [Actinocorallia herbida]
MPRPVLGRPAVLAVLGLLAERNAHPHLMLDDLRRRGPVHAAAISRSAVYHAVGTLTEEGWIEAVGHEPTGTGQVRTVYALTDAGRAQLVRRLDAEVRTPQREFSRFLGALARLDALGARGTVEALAERVARMRRSAAVDRARLAAARTAGVPRIRLLEAEYHLRLTEAEAAWAEELADDILGGAVRWPSPAGPQNPE